MPSFFVTMFQVSDWRRFLKPWWDAIDDVRGSFRKWWKWLSDSAQSQSESETQRTGLVPLWRMEGPVHQVTAYMRAHVNI